MTSSTPPQNSDDAANCYDDGKKLLLTFINSYMKFSSGLYETGAETQDEAARQMLDRLIDQGRVKNGTKILDVGSGWGCLRKRLGERDLNVFYTAVNPSASQNQHLKTFLAPQDKVIEGFLADVPRDQKFDAIFLVACFCHMTDKFEQLKTVEKLLAPGGRLVIEETFFISNELRERYGRNSLSEVQDKLYGWAEALTFAKFIEDCARAGLVVEESRNITDSYYRTGQDWLKGLFKADVPFAEKSEMITVFRVSQLGWNKSVIYMQVTLKRPESPKVTV